MVNSNNLGETRLQIAIHDTPFKISGKTVEELNITVIRIDIIRTIDNKLITLSEKEQKMDILKIYSNAPVVLSDVSLEPGTYDQLRLVLKDDSTIKIDGEIFDIKIPSGEQSGLKLNGPFEIVKGKLFRINIDFIAEKSVLWTKGQGYKLKPVIQISSTSDIVGYFRGELSIDSKYGSSQIILELKSDNTFRMKISNYPDYTLKGNYFYNSIDRKLKFYEFSLDASNLIQEVKDKILKDMTSLVFPVKEWALDELILIDIYQKECRLCKVSDFSFSSEYLSTKIFVSLQYPNFNMDKKNVVVKIEICDSDFPFVYEISKFVGKSTNLIVNIPNFYIKDINQKIRATSFIFENSEDMNFEVGVYNGIGTLMLKGSTILESSNNPWIEEKYYFVNKNGVNNVEINFIQMLNIKANISDNLEDINISWNNFPGASKYCLLILTKKQIEDKWALSYQKITFSTNINTNIKKFVTPINSGVVIRAEVYALDSSNKLDTKNKSGALFMDSITFIK